MWGQKKQKNNDIYIKYFDQQKKKLAIKILKLNDVVGTHQDNASI